MPDSQKLKDLEERLETICFQEDKIEKEIYKEQWRIVQEETGVREGAIIITATEEFLVTGLYNYNPRGFHALCGKLRHSNGEFSDTPRGIFDDWKLKEGQDA